MLNNNSENRGWMYLAAIVMMAAALKIWLTFSGVVPFNADEAVVALMARHILNGELAIFFYGQAYMGSLDALIVAAGFALFGEHVWVIRIIQGMLYLGVVITTVLLGNAIFKDKRIGLLAGLLLAIPTVNMSLYTTASLGGYGETLLMGNLILLVGTRLDEEFKTESQVTPWRWSLYGFLCGFSFWAFGLSLVYSLPMSALLLCRFIRTRSVSYFRLPALSVVIGVLVGATPWWIYAYQYGVASLAGELLGGAIAGVEGLSWLGQAWQHLVSLVLLGGTVVFGFRPPWGVQWLGLPLLPFVLAFFIATLGFSGMKLLKERAQDHSRILLHSLVWVVVLGFVFTPYGADPSGRYFVPLAIPLALFSAEFILLIFQRSKLLAWSLVIMVLVFNLWGTIQSASRFPPGLTTQFSEITQIDNRYYDELIAFLEAHGEAYGYTNYWVSYPLAFLAEEKLIYIPRLPYHLDFRYTPRDDRYLPYTRTVENAKQVAYITTRHTALDNYLRTKFLAQNITWEEQMIGDFHIFYNLSKAVHVEQIGLGELQP